VMRIKIYMYIKPNVIRVNLCVRYRKVYGLCRFNLQKFETMGIHLKGDLYWISFYPWFGLDRFHRTLYQNTFPFSHKVE